MKDPSAIDTDAPGIGGLRRKRRPATVVGLRLSEAMLERLTAYAEEHGITRSVAIRRLLSQGLDRG